MLSVGSLAPTSSTLVTTASATTPTPQSPFLTSALIGNYSLDVPQGDQPGPPFSEGTPLQPTHWSLSTNRTHYIKSRYGKYLEMWPDGQVHTVSEPTAFSIFILLSHLSHIVMKGFVSDKYLCMNATSSKLYTRDAKHHVHQDCYLNETVRGSFLVYIFQNCSINDKRCYLGHYRNGTMRLGSNARRSQQTAQWIKSTPPEDDVKEARHLKEKIRKDISMGGGGGWTPPSPPPEIPTVKPVDRREQRRKRVRRWCLNLTIIVRRKEKFLGRCKRNCDILKKMIEEPRKHLRRCLQRQIVRRKRKKARKSGKPVTIDKARVKERVKKLWPKREEIFRRLRQLRRCNKRRKSRRRKGRCSPADVRRAARRRACARGKRKRCPGSRSSERRSRPRPSSAPGTEPKHPIRHHHKTTRGEHRHKNKQTDKNSAESKPDVQNPQVKTDSKMLSALTRR